MESKVVFRCVFFFALLLFSRNVFCQIGNFDFSDTTMTKGKIVSIRKVGEIKVVTCKRYSHFLKDFVRFQMYVLPDTQVRLPKKHSIIWQNFPFVKARYQFKRLCPKDKVYIYEDIRELCFEEYDVCIFSAANAFGSLCELIEIKRLN